MVCATETNLYFLCKHGIPYINRSMTNFNKIASRILILFCRQDASYNLCSCSFPLDVTVIGGFVHIYKTILISAPELYNRQDGRCPDATVAITLSSYTRDPSDLTFLGRQDLTGRSVQDMCNKPPSTAGHKAPVTERDLSHCRSEVVRTEKQLIL